MSESNADCPVCRSNSGEERISPGAPIFEGDAWVVEHAYPSALLGWLVIVLKRHAEALHELSRAECQELGTLQWAVSRALHEETACLKEYCVFFAEQPRFGHVHFHVIPRAHDHDPDRLGGKAFAYLKAPAEEVVAPREVESFCARLRAKVGGLMSESVGGLTSEGIAGS